MANFGATTSLSGGTITLTLPTGARYWYIQAQDLGAFKITFTGGNGSFGPVTLNAASAAGAAGDWLDSIGFPWFGTSVTITNATTSTAQFGSGYTTDLPYNSYDIAGTYR